MNERARRARILLAGSLLGGVPLAPLALLESACRSRATPEECRAMTEHYLDLAVREAPGGARLTSPQASAVREVERGLKRAEPAFRAVQDRCADVTRAEVSCGTDAPSTRDWEACFKDAGR
jgi:hypothetical protein